MFLSASCKRYLPVLHKCLKLSPKFCYDQQISRKLHSGANDYRDSLIEFQNVWPPQEKIDFMNDMKIIPNFLTLNEEDNMLDEIEPYLKRLHYEHDHWDDAIHGYRETERKHWYPHNRETIDKVSMIAFNGEIMPYIHILDLDEKGVIKPHVDSTRYCGPIIAGISLLSDCVMRLVRIDKSKYLQKSNGDYRTQPITTNKTISEDNFYADILLKRRSLYIMRDSARYNFTHEVLSNENSKFANKMIPKKRRISIICRNEP